MNSLAPLESAPNSAKLAGLTRYFHSTTEHSHRLCTVEPLGRITRVKMVVFDSMNGKTFVVERCWEMECPSAFIDDVLVRIQHFIEVSQSTFELEQLQFRANPTSNAHRSF